MIAYNRFKSEKDYNSFRYDLLLWTEEAGTIKNNPYLDGRKIPTMGVGINLRVSDNLDEVLKEMGFNPKNKELNERKYIKQIRSAIFKTYSKGQDEILQKNLNKIMSDWAKDDKVIAHEGMGKRSQFRLDDNEIKRVFDKIAPNYENKVNNWINRHDLNIERFSYERAVLLSMAYNSPKLLGPKLAKAVKEGNRQEASLQIMHESNKKNGKGVAKRYLLVGMIFGPFNDLKNITEAEKKEFAEMRKSFAGKEQLFGAAGSRKINGQRIPSAAAKDYREFITKYLNDRDLNLTPEEFLAYAEYPGKAKDKTKAHKKVAFDTENILPDIEPLASQDQRGEYSIYPASELRKVAFAGLDAIEVRKEVMRGLFSQNWGKPLEEPVIEMGAVFHHLTDDEQKTAITGAKLMKEREDLNKETQRRNEIAEAYGYNRFYAKIPNFMKNRHQKDYDQWGRELEKKELDLSTREMENRPEMEKVLAKVRTSEFRDKTAQTLSEFRTSEAERIKELATLDKEWNSFEGQKFCINRLIDQLPKSIGNMAVQVKGDPKDIDNLLKQSDQIAAQTEPAIEMARQYDRGMQYT
jgi:hypothetical protein